MTTTILTPPPTKRPGHRAAGRGGWPGREPHRSHSQIDGVTYRVAATPEQRRAAFCLINDAYTRAGLMQPNVCQALVTEFHLLPTTDVFVATRGDQVIYTVTLISDDELGMPMDSVCPEPIDQRRRAGLYLAEAACLASRKDYLPPAEMLRVHFRLFGLMFQYARHHRVDRILAVVHPLYRELYTYQLGFTPLDEIDCYRQVCGSPPVACEQDLARAEQERFPLYDDVYGHPYAPWELLRQPMLQDERISYMLGCWPDSPRPHVAAPVGPGHC